MTLRGLMRRGSEGGGGGSGGHGPTPREAMNALLRTSFEFFVSNVFQTLYPGEPFKRTWYLRAMCAVGQDIVDGKTQRHIINVPPRSGKSTIFSVALPAFMLGLQPSTKIICVSYTERLALNFSRDTLKVMESAWYRQAFPHVRIPSPTDEKLETTANGYRLATSIGGAGLGLGADLIVIDDPMKAEDARSVVMRERVDRFYRDTLSTRFYDPRKGAILVIMQRLHEDDLCGRILVSDPWPILRFPAVSDVDDEVLIGAKHTHTRRIGDLLDPDRLPQSELDKKRKLMGSDVYSAQYLQAPTPAEGVIIRAEWLTFYKTPPLRLSLRIVQSWDTAVKGDPSSDLSVCTTWGELKGAHYLLDVHRSRMHFPDLVRQAGDLFGRYQPVAVLVEAQGSEVQLGRMLRQQYNIHTIEQRPKRDKQTRLADVSPMFEAGQVILPEDAPWLPEYQREIVGFPQTRHDDQVDSTSQYLAWAGSRGTGLEVFWT